MMERTLNILRVGAMLAAAALLAGCATYDYGDRSRYGRHHDSYYGHRHHHDRVSVGVSYGYGYGSSSYYLYDPFWYLGSGFALNYRYIPSYYYSSGHYPYYYDYYWHYPVRRSGIYHGYTPRHAWFDRGFRPDRHRPSHGDVASEAVRLSRGARHVSGAPDPSALNPRVIRQPKSTRDPVVTDEVRRLTRPDHDVSDDRSRYERIDVDDRERRTLPTRTRSMEIPTVRYQPDDRTPTVRVPDTRPESPPSRSSQHRSRQPVQSREPVRVDRSPGVTPDTRFDRPTRQVAPVTRSMPRSAPVTPTRSHTVAPARSAPRSAPPRSLPQVSAPPRPAVRTEAPRHSSRSDDDNRLRHRPR